MIVQNATPVFTGEVASFSRKGNKLSGKAKFGGGLFDTQWPPFQEGIMCNHLRGSNADGSFLISAGCALLKSAWQFTGQVHSPVSAAYPFALALGPLTGVGAAAATALAGAGIYANWFALGWLEWGAGAAIQRRQIIGSSVISGGVMTLTLHRYFSALPALGDLVTFYPGCDGDWRTCQAFEASLNPTGKFNNRVNFGGTPFLPIANPSSPVKTDTGKK